MQQRRDGVLWSREGQLRRQIRPRSGVEQAALARLDPNLGPRPTKQATQIYLHEIAGTDPSSLIGQAGILHGVKRIKGPSNCAPVQSYFVLDIAQATQAAYSRAS